VPDWDTVREIAGALPAAEESTTYGQPAFKVAGKLFVWMSPQRDAQGALALRVDPDEKELVLASDANVYFTVPHYDGHPAVLLRLDRIDREELRERIEDAWLLRAPKRLADDFAGKGA
jgi:hypothetical protein